MSRPSLCFFPQYFLPTIKTPVFIVMSAFDQIQIRYNLLPADEICLLNHNCTYERLEAMQDLRKHVLFALPKACPLERGLWITSCIAHDIPYDWNKTFPQVLRDWYINKSYLPVIDGSDTPKNCTLQGISPHHPHT
ncbi:unnamed protein product [Cuscuta epithymum]|uniref:Pectin acetylesterase n=1 Tax=Cuscuta epithymum TaxID=186058 RepID=A0AAV0G060_9ASTE|nr:unnamed protein product [Cuscuta epithymum]CAH9141296.1 unnamed protein product [Cuscuta epithymum]